MHKKLGKCFACMLVAGLLFAILPMESSSVMSQGYDEVIVTPFDIERDNIRAD